MGRPRIIMKPTPMVRKAAGQMRKLLGLWSNSQRRKAQTVTGTNANPKPIIKEGNPQFLQATHGLDTKYITRRQIVLNRHFTEIISDVLANNLKKQLNEIGVNITSIETKAWNKGVSVFYTLGKPFTETIHNELNSLVPLVRAAITERQLIGRTPPVNFVFDESAELDRTIETALANVRKPELTEESRLVEDTSEKVWAAKTNFVAKEPKLVANRFSAPSDMSNMMLGLNYESFYNQVAAKLERGRAESMRMSTNTSLLSSKPLMRVPYENDDVENPALRVVKMQNFIVSQKKKNEYHAKMRRKQELLYRDAVSWEWPEEGEGEGEEIVEER